MSSGKRLQIVHGDGDLTKPRVIAIGFDPHEDADDLAQIAAWAKEPGMLLAVSDDVEIEHVRW